MNAPCDLSGQVILVTRPAEQAAGLCQLIHTAGGVAQSFPTVIIRPGRQMTAAQALLRATWDVWIFVSRNAVNYALPLLPDQRLPTDVALAAVGAGTAVALRQAGRVPDLIPANQKFDSEGLLALRQLRHVKGQRILIVRGEGGRAVLAETLMQRGAEVAYAEVYRRALPEVEVKPLIAEWRRSLNLLTATSDEILNNLYQLVPEADQAWLRSLPLAVFSERTAATAMQLGFRVVAVASEASDAALLEALCRLVTMRPRLPMPKRLVATVN
ncbi:uroporphyrinogen-III synthase [Thiospirillum jenense]|uniref:Uroporphyrinogen-III synthase n=1 Tax=Thiospirillum jenense TaxID=1653858 RepID=A0A839HBR8_9GAMM|nr:uroporphyrinogen-III synthase [Thiospirillum jenense]MBB1125620.1 uroporphyrinogen-III synthase [Thiospirillum jenense]